MGKNKIKIKNISDVKMKRREKRAQHFDALIKQELVTVQKSHLIKST